MTSNDTEKSQGFAGTLNQIQLVDLIQMCCQAGLSLAVKVEKGDETGTIVIEQGRIIHAVSGDTSGEKAFYRVLSWQSGNFETLGAVFVAKPTIDKNSQYLLMEASRLFDETALGSEKSGAEPLNQHEPVVEEEKIKVLIVDDSAIICKVLTEIFEKDDDIKVVGTAENGELALEQIKKLKPDLITLDVNMPVMSGSTALKHIMINSPCPVVIISNPGNHSRVNIIDFLRLGAVDFIAKPKNSGDIKRQHEQITSRVKKAAGATLTGVRRAKKIPPVSGQSLVQKVKTPCERLIVIKSGAGGFSDLIRLISLIPAQFSACVVVFQSMPESFTGLFSDYMNERCNAFIEPLTTGSGLFNNLCLIASDEMSFSAEPKNSETIFLSPLKESCENTFNTFLDSVSDIFMEELLVFQLSGAESLNLSGLKGVRKNGGTVIVQKPSEAVLSKGLNHILNESIAEREASISEVAEMVKLWKTN